MTVRYWNNKYDVLLCLFIKHNKIDLNSFYLYNKNVVRS